MSTNFYLCAPHLDEFKDGDDPGMHIGKSSGGWTFSWRAHDELGLTTRDAWERFMAEQGDCVIMSEYNEPFSFARFREIAYIENRDPYGEKLRLHHAGGAHPQTVDVRGEVFSHYEFC